MVVDGVHQGDDAMTSPLPDGLTTSATAALPAASDGHVDPCKDGNDNCSDAPSNKKAKIDAGDRGCKKAAISAKTISKLKLPDVNPYLTCVICKGYYINAVTLTECLHSFCKTCILSYLKASKTCPICDVQVHKTKPLLNARSDKTLQDIVYKMVPGLYKSEMKRRRQFYAKHPHPNVTPSEESGEIEDRIIYSPDEKISLSLEFYTLQAAEQFQKRLFQYRNRLANPETEALTADLNQNTASRRYLCCPAAVTVHHLQKFIKMKFALGPSDKVQIVYCGEVLKDSWTLMDIAYIYTWRRNGPIRLFFQIIRDQVKKPNIAPVIELKAKENLPEKILTPPLPADVATMQKPAEKVEEAAKILPKPIVVQKPAPQPVKFRHVQPKPPQVQLPNHDVVTSSHHHKSESSKTIAELINERKMMKRQDKGVIDPTVNIDNRVKVNGYPNQMNRLLITRAPVPVPLLQCAMKPSNVPIAPKPPPVIRKYGKVNQDPGPLRNAGLGFNRIQKVVPPTIQGPPQLPQMKMKAGQKRKKPNDEPTPPVAKIQKVSSTAEVNMVPPSRVANVVVDKPESHIAAPEASKIVGCTESSSAKSGCDQSANLKAKEAAKNGVNGGGKQEPVQKQKSEDKSPTSDQTKSNAPANGVEDRIRESPPPDSLVIVTSSPEDGAKSPLQSNGTRPDDKATLKEKSRKQKSLDEVVKNLALFSKEAPKSSETSPITNEEPKKDDEKQKSSSGRPPNFCPLDLSRKHLNLPVIPAPLPPTSKMFSTINQLHLKPSKVSTPDTDKNTNVKQPSANVISITTSSINNNNNNHHIQHHHHNNNSSKISSSVSATTATTFVSESTTNTNGCTKTSKVQTNHHNAGGSKSSKSPGKSPKCPMPIAPPVSLSTIGGYLPHQLYSRQRLELLSKYSPHMLNMNLYSSMVGSPRSPVPKPTKKL